MLKAIVGFFQDIEKTCNEIGVAANNMTLNTGHPALRVILK